MHLDATTLTWQGESGGKLALRFIILILHIVRLVRHTRIIIVIIIVKVVFLRRTSAPDLSTDRYNELTSSSAASYSHQRP